jgi:pyruvate/2-oxoglutarate dehydrogenase complex dihydrolipoamide dehydrogenase (E3) component/uncharacterized membrane protein YdjX (TVP38/TMEM64 family)
MTTTHSRSRTSRTLAWVALIVVAVAAWQLLGDALTLDNLRAQQVAWSERVAASPWLSSGAYLVVYIVATALSIPGATLLTLLGGALFGWVWGSVLVSIASTLGATAAMLLARSLLRDQVAQRFGARLAGINAGLEREGVFYLLSLRLIPAVPFFALNLLMGLTRMRVGTYMWVSWLGMLPATLAYVNAGLQLSTITSLQGLVSPALWASLVLLGLLPWLIKAVLAVWRRRQVYRDWAHLKPRSFDRNLIVIGAGAAGLVTAYIAAATRAKVSLIEQAAMGGDCLNQGCVPSKALIHCARTITHAQDAQAMGLMDASITPGAFAQAIRHVQSAIAQVAPHDSVERYTGLGVEVFKGHAQLTSPWHVEITLSDGSTQTLSARHVVLATGAEPVIPAISGLAEVPYFTSDTLWQHLGSLAQAPRRVVVLGGGPIGCELGQALASLGSLVHVVQKTPQLLPREDADVAERVEQAMRAQGMNLWLSHQATAVSNGPDGVVVNLSGPNGAVTLDADVLLLALGRTARTRGFGLDTLGLAAKRVIDHDAYLQTALPNILVAGDAAGPQQFTHAAAHQAWVAAVNALFGRFWRFKAATAVMPAVTFTSPEVARVGINENEARAQDTAIEVTRYEWAESDRAITEGATDGFVKVITAAGSDKILGVSIVGAHAGEVLPEWVLAMRHGLGLKKVLATVHAYPTWAEGNKAAAGLWQQAHSPERVLRWVQGFHRWERGA